MSYTPAIHTDVATTPAGSRTGWVGTDLDFGYSPYQSASRYACPTGCRRTHRPDPTARRRRSPRGRRRRPRRGRARPGGRGHWKTYPRTASRRAGVPIPSTGPTGLGPTIGTAGTANRSQVACVLIGCVGLGGDRAVQYGHVGVGGVVVIARLAVLQAVYGGDGLPGPEPDDLDAAVDADAHLRGIPPASGGRERSDIRYVNHRSSTQFYWLVTTRSACRMIL